MVRAALVMVILAASGAALAAPHGWSATIPPGWTDSSAEMRATPQLQAFAQKFTDRGDAFEASSYTSPDSTGMLLVATSESGDKPAAVSDLETVESSARESAAEGGTEASYAAERTPLTIGATQRVAGKAAPIVNRRFTGVLTSGHARTVAAVCYGEPAVCDPLVASIQLDTSDLAPLSTLPAQRTSQTLAYRIGIAVASVLVALAMVLWFRRYRAARR